MEISVIHSVKGDRIRSYSGLHLPAFEYGEMWSISPYTVRMRENADQNNFKYGLFTLWKNVEHSQNERKRMQ